MTTLVDHRCELPLQMPFRKPHKITGNKMLASGIWEQQLQGRKYRKFVLFADSLLIRRKQRGRSAPASHTWGSRNCGFPCKIIVSNWFSPLSWGVCHRRKLEPRSGREHRRRGSTLLLQLRSLLNDFLRLLANVPLITGFYHEVSHWNSDKLNLPYI